MTDLFGKNPLCCVRPPTSDAGSALAAYTFHAPLPPFHMICSKAGQSRAYSPSTRQNLCDLTVSKLILANYQTG